jgi:acetyl-CoA decarbonylase/synthase complex subunit beta
MAEKNSQEHKNDIECNTGFLGTEFKYPLLYAIKGKTTPEEMGENLSLGFNRQHINYLWSTEIQESLEPDKENYFITDDNFRRLCVGLNEGSNGWVLITGLDNKTDVEELIMELDSRRLKPFAYGLTATKLRKHEYQFKDLGPRETGIIYFGQLLVRYALIYAREIGGDPHEVSHSIEEYAPGVILLLGNPGEREKVLLQGLLGMGVPIVSLKTDYGLEGHINTSQSIHEMMEKVWKLPNIRVRLVERASADLSVPSGPIYRRETLREEDVHIRIPASKYSFMISMPSEVKRDVVEVEGLMETATGFSILTELGSPDVEPDITLWVDAIIQKVSNYAKGIKIQRNRDRELEFLVTAEAVQAGFTIDQLGYLIITELRNEFPSIGPVKVTFILDIAEEERIRAIIDDYKNERKRLIDQATEENLQSFYGCTRCRSFSLGHACTVTPDRPAQCSKPWYMLKAYAVLAPDSTYNPCTLIEKGECLDPNRGEYSGVNRSTYNRTKGRVNRVFLHSIFDYPHTACSCFQNVAYYVPEVDGIAIMDRSYKGKGPGEMTWTKLANMVAGRQYRDGAAPIATQYLKSVKFLKADGGYKRVVWMTDKLKTFAKESIPEKYGKRIATEKNAITVEELKRLSLQ